MLRKITQIFFITILTLPFSSRLRAQVKDTIPDSIDPRLQEVLESPQPREYVIGGLKVTGTKRYDDIYFFPFWFNVGDRVTVRAAIFQ